MADTNASGLLRTRQEAKERGLNKFFTGRPCRRGHVSPRYTSCNLCCACTVINRKRWRAENPDQSKQLRRNWRKKNPEKERASKYKSNRKWWARVKDSVNAKKRQSWKEDPEPIRQRNKASFKRRYAANPAKIKESGLRWRTANKDRYKISHNRAVARLFEKDPTWGSRKAAKRRAIKRSVGGEFTREDVDDIKKMQRNRCALCREPLVKFHIDHIFLCRAGEQTVVAIFSFFVRRAIYARVRMILLITRDH